MNKNKFLSYITILLISVTGFNSPALAEDSTSADSYEADRKILRKLLVDIESAINTNNISVLVPYLDDDIVIIHQNAHIAKGIDEVISYNEKMTKGPDAPIKKLTTRASIGGPAYFHGDNMAIGYGTAVDDIELKSGETFSLEVTWSATLVKKDGNWKAAAIHFSTNVLDNVILNRVRDMLWWFGGGGIILGLLIGWLVGKRRKV